MRLDTNVLVKVKTARGVVLLFSEYYLFKQKFPEITNYANYIDILWLNSQQIDPEQSEDYQRDLSFLKVAREKGSIDDSEFKFYLEWSKRVTNSSAGVNLFLRSEDVENMSLGRIALRKSSLFREVVTPLLKDYLNTGNLLWERDSFGATSLFERILSGSIPAGEAVLRSYVELVKSIWYNPTEAYEFLESLLEGSGLGVEKLVDVLSFYSPVVSKNENSGNGGKGASNLLRQKLLTAVSELTTFLGQYSELGKIAWHVFVKEVSKAFITRSVADSIVKLEKMEQLERISDLIPQEGLLKREKENINKGIAALKDLAIYNEDFFRRTLLDTLQKEMDTVGQSNCLNCLHALTCSVVCKKVRAEFYPVMSRREDLDCRVCPKAEECKVFMTKAEKDKTCNQFVMNDSSLTKLLVESIVAKYGLGSSKRGENERKDMSLCTCKFRAS